MPLNVDSFLKTVKEKLENQQVFISWLKLPAGSTSDHLTNAIYFRESVLSAEYEKWVRDLSEEQQKNLASAFTQHPNIPAIKYAKTYVEQITPLRECATHEAPEKVLEAWLQSSEDNSNEKFLAERSLDEIFQYPLETPDTENSNTISIAKVILLHFLKKDGSAVLFHQWLQNPDNIRVAKKIDVKLILGEAEYSAVVKNNIAVFVSEIGKNCADLESRDPDKGLRELSIWMLTDRNSELVDIAKKQNSFQDTSDYYRLIVAAEEQCNLTNSVIQKIKSDKYVTDKSLKTVVMGKPLQKELLRLQSSRLIETPFLKLISQSIEIAMSIENIVNMQDSDKDRKALLKALLAPSSTKADDKVGMQLKVLKILCGDQYSDLEADILKEFCEYSLSATTIPSPSLITLEVLVSKFVEVGVDATGIDAETRNDAFRMAFRHLMIVSPRMAETLITTPSLLSKLCTSLKNNRLNFVLPKACENKSMEVIALFAKTAAGSLLRDGSNEDIKTVLVACENYSHHPKANKGMKDSADTFRKVLVEALQETLKLSDKALKKIGSKYSLTNEAIKKIYIERLKNAPSNYIPKMLLDFDAVTSQEEKQILKAAVDEWIKESLTDSQKVLEQLVTWLKWKVPDSEIVELLAIIKEVLVKTHLPEDDAVWALIKAYGERLPVNEKAVFVKNMGPYLVEKVESAEQIAKAMECLSAWDAALSVKDLTSLFVKYNATKLLLSIAASNFSGRSPSTESHSSGDRPTSIVASSSSPSKGGLLSRMSSPAKTLKGDSPSKPEKTASNVSEEEIRLFLICVDRSLTAVLSSNIDIDDGNHPMVGMIALFNAFSGGFDQAEYEWRFAVQKGSSLLEKQKALSITLCNSLIECMKQWEKKNSPGNFRPFSGQWVPIKQAFNNETITPQHQQQEQVNEPDFTALGREFSHAVQLRKDGIADSIRNTNDQNKKIFLRDFISVFDQSSYSVIAGSLPQVCPLVELPVLWSVLKDKYLDNALTLVAKESFIDAILTQPNVIQIILAQVAPDVNIDDRFNFFSWKDIQRLVKGYQGEMMNNNLADDKVSLKNFIKSWVDRHLQVNAPLPCIPLDATVDLQIQAFKNLVDVIGIECLWKVLEKEWHATLLDNQAVKKRQLVETLKQSGVMAKVFPQVALSCINLFKLEDTKQLIEHYKKMPLGEDKIALKRLINSWMEKKIPEIGYDALWELVGNNDQIIIDDLSYKLAEASQLIEPLANLPQGGQRPTPVETLRIVENSYQTILANSTFNGANQSRVIDYVLPENAPQFTIVNAIDSALWAVRNKKNTFNTLLGNYLTKFKNSFRGNDVKALQCIYDTLCLALTIGGERTKETFNMFMNDSEFFDKLIEFGGNNVLITKILQALFMVNAAEFLTKLSAPQRIQQWYFAADRLELSAWIQTKENLQNSSSEADPLETGWLKKNKFDTPAMEHVHPGHKAFVANNYAEHRKNYLSSVNPSAQTIFQRLASWLKNIFSSSPAPMHGVSYTLVETNEYANDLFKETRSEKDVITSLLEGKESFEKLWWRTEKSVLDKTLPRVEFDRVLNALKKNWFTSSGVKTLNNWIDGVKIDSGVLTKAQDNLKILIDEAVKLKKEGELSPKDVKQVNDILQSINRHLKRASQAVDKRNALSEIIFPTAISIGEGGVRGIARTLSESVVIASSARDNSQSHVNAQSEINMAISHSNVNSQNSGCLKAGLYGYGRVSTDTDVSSNKSRSLSLGSREDSI